MSETATQPRSLVWLARQESRGAHYRVDFPEPREEWRRHTTFRRP